MFTEIKASNLCKFVQKNILSRFGIPKRLVADNGEIFVSQDFKKLCKKFKIELHHSSPYYPKVMGKLKLLIKR